MNEKREKKENSPRPDWYREEWIDLNGSWQFAFDDDGKGMEEEWYREHAYTMTIQVPFCFQSKASGIGLAKEAHTRLWYERWLPLEERMRGKRLWLHFGAVDYSCLVWINGKYAGSHKGGFTSHSYEITPYIDWDETDIRITVACQDDYFVTQVRGKQHWDLETDRCWYTATSGIWQNVWMEMTPGYRIEQARITPDIDRKTVEMKLRFSDCPDRGKLVWKLFFQGKEKKQGVASLQDRMERVLFSVENEDPIDNKIHLWEPGQPNLYDLVLEVYQGDVLQDRVETYFGMRKIERKGSRIYLNHYPLYQKLVLDQGYWQESLMTPPDAQALVRDLKLAQDMGFNGVRKHQKIEDPRFLYHADRMGMLVWEEMPSFYAFDEAGVQGFTQEYTEMIERDYNHPCIIAWVPFNESWGIRDVLWDKAQQAFAKSMYFLTKALDAGRLVSTNDGWEAVQTDMIGIHDYEDDPAKLHEVYARKEELMAYTAVGKMICSEDFVYTDEPVLLSEFGGIALEDGRQESWGYHEKARDAEVLKEKIEGILQVVHKLPYLSGYCYTQLTDVEQETNGLLYADRTPKLALEQIRAVFGDSSVKSN